MLLFRLDIDRYLLHFYSLKKTVTERLARKWKILLGRLSAWELMPASWCYDPGLSSIWFLISHRKLTKFLGSLVVPFFFSLISPSFQIRMRSHGSDSSLHRECAASEYPEGDRVYLSPWKSQNKTRLIDS